MYNVMLPLNGTDGAPVAAQTGDEVRYRKALAPAQEGAVRSALYGELPEPAVRVCLGSNVAF